jgi:filamentous hemagglutinin
MRIMGATIDGKTESGAPDTLIGQTAPTDAGANWLYAGKTADSSPILTQINAAVNSELQSYIRNNYTSVGAGVPGAVTGYVTSPKQPKLGRMTAPISTAGTICPLGDCGIAVYGPSKNQVANTASSISVAAGRFGAVTTAAAEFPSPYSRAFASAAFAATVIGWIAGGLEQALRPNVGQYAFSTAVGEERKSWPIEFRWDHLQLTKLQNY